MDWGSEAGSVPLRGGWGCSEEAGGRGSGLVAWWCDGGGLKGGIL
jgi:hypothetical protein